MNIIKKFVIVGLVGVSLAGCSQIDSGNVGVESTFGQIKNQTLPPGLYNSLFKTIYEINTKEYPLEINDLKPKTRDNITLSDLDVTIYYKVNPSEVANIMLKYNGDLTRDQNGDYVVGYNLMTRLGRESAYRAAAKFNSYDIHTKRDEIAELIKQSLQEEVNSDAGKGSFLISNVIIRSIITDPSLEKSIRDAAEMEFNIRKKNQELDLAKAEAARKKVESEGEAVANKIISDSLSDKLIELRRIEAMKGFAVQGTHTVIIPQGQNVTPLIGK